MYLLIEYYGGRRIRSHTYSRHGPYAEEFIVFGEFESLKRVDGVVPTLLHRRSKHIEKLLNGAQLILAGRLQLLDEHFTFLLEGEILLLEIDGYNGLPLNFGIENRIRCLWSTCTHKDSSNVAMFDEKLVDCAATCPRNIDLQNITRDDKLVVHASRCFQQIPAILENIRFIWTQKVPLDLRHIILLKVNRNARFANELLDLNVLRQEDYILDAQLSHHKSGEIIEQLRIAKRLRQFIHHIFRGALLLA
mmetsp:Transcript_13332/g.20152  ORF Transcript_13332/g.20152 Transcript_13332/m.20152 type:complete len:249 (+) Transcript_13332:220-966(+)